MWKKAYKFLLYTIITVGCVFSLLFAIVCGITGYSFVEIIAITLQDPNLETVAMVAGVITGLLGLIGGVLLTFMAAMGIGFAIEVADDIEQIKINTTPKAPEPKQPIPEQDRIDINKYIYPYQ